MGHDHIHHEGTKNIKVAFFINLIFTIIEIIGGFMTNSVAILSDAVHDLGDSLSLGLAWYFQNLSSKGRDKFFSYGYGRFSLLGALINVFVLLIGSVLILWKTIPRLIAPEEVDTQGMMILAVIGVLFNGLAVYQMRKGKSMNERVVSLHLMEDVLGWIAVLIGALIMHFNDLPIIDPILSILITAYILYNVFGNLKRAMSTFLQDIPDDISMEEVSQTLANHDEVDSVHDLHIWSMDGEHHVLTAHLVIKEGLTKEEQSLLKRGIRDDLTGFHIDHATLELEYFGEDCGMDDC